MKKLRALCGLALAMSAMNASAKGVDYCNSTQNKTECDIVVAVKYDAVAGTCTAEAPHIKLWRNLDTTRKVKLTWKLDAGAASARRFHFSDARPGIDLDDPLKYFEDAELERPRLYKWVAKGVQGRWWVGYNVYVQYDVPATGTIDCTQVDPMITNQD